MIKPKNLLKHQPRPENSPIGPKKPQNDPQKQNIKKPENKQSYYKMKAICL